ncbi:hypothetical protein [Kitasatospora sp. GP82]|uniref:hypothetical protein n=1 Tax=Kitasatospora sp. GP82 TaxID=3035089 RepID=UPI002474FE54|nr:hypothetical protein [Kitasatospora sp. GP82]MDH6125012.1 hypothetical protein [Kitasatospora sp. GP82]
MSSDSNSGSAAIDLADVLDDLAERAAVPGTTREVRVTIEAPYDVEQRTVRLSADVAGRVAEVLRGELDTFGADLRTAVEGLEEGSGDEAGNEDGGLEGPDPERTEMWWG